MDANNKIFDFAYMMAFRDATMRNAFPRWEEEKNDDGTFHKRKDEIKNYSKPIVQNYINTVVEANLQTKQESLAVINRLCDEENTARGFTFGNAQKLVNMTAKYMFISAYAAREKRELFKNCHCPMDGVMMDWVKKHCRDYGLPNVKFDIPWSKLRIDDEKSLNEYKVFQDYIDKIAMMEEIFAIEVDFLYWDE